jgi:peroxiredoxin Q/BCP
MMTTLKPGDAAPDFAATDQHGNEIALKSLKGKKVVLYFYPKDDTPGCTAEACNLRDNHTDLINKGYVVIGVSPDALKAHTKFTEKYELPFSLLPDTDKKIIQAYGVWGPKKFMGKSYDGVYRTTFLIDENGKIEKIFDQVDTKNHTSQILNS